MDIRINPKKLDGEIEAPSSKSVLHRLLICAALSKKESSIAVNSMSEDIKATIRCLEATGTVIHCDGKKICVIPSSAFPKKAEFDCGESGSTLRFMVPIAAALGIEATFTGSGRLPSRPMKPLLDALKQNGVEVNDGFPIKIKGKLKNGNYVLPGNISSQFTTGLLLALPLCNGESTVELTGKIESAEYIKITVTTMNKFGVEIIQTDNIYRIKQTEYQSKDFSCEGDWSNAAFWLAGGIGVTGVDSLSAQGDKKIIDILNNFGASYHCSGGKHLFDFNHTNATVINASEIPDLVPIISVVAATAEGQTVITNAERLRLKESDRLESTAQMINNLGGEAKVVNDGLIINGKNKLKGGTVDSFNDHRIVMSAAIAAQNCGNAVIIKNAQAVAKSYPDFFEKYNSVGGEADVM